MLFNLVLDSLNVYSCQSISHKQKAVLKDVSTDIIFKDQNTLIGMMGHRALRAIKRLLSGDLVAEYQMYLTCHLRVECPVNAPTNHCAIMLVTSVSIIFVQ